MRSITAKELDLVAYVTIKLYIFFLWSNIFLLKKLGWKMSWIKFATQVILFMKLCPMIYLTIFQRGKMYYITYGIHLILLMKREHSLHLTVFSKLQPVLKDQILAFSRISHWDFNTISHKFGVRKSFIFWFWGKQLVRVVLHQSTWFSWKKLDEKGNELLVLLMKI